MLSKISCIHIVGFGCNYQWTDSHSPNVFQLRADLQGRKCSKLARTGPESIVNGSYGVTLSKSIALIQMVKNIAVTVFTKFRKIKHKHYFSSLFALFPSGT